MNLTGTDKQIDFATTIVATIESKLSELNAKIEASEKGPKKNTLKFYAEVLLSYSAAFAAVNAIHAGNIDKAGNDLDALAYGSQGHAFEIVNSLASSLDSKTVDAGTLIDATKSIFYKVTKDWQI